ncbi:MAG: universal stress protein [Gammaproteobacteria bacterium]|nr:universal stress protein [Gammaproteobacteria bacterium]MBU1414713.1 universal stress protein [Gammaproteobacteria bacterium]
MSEVAGEFRVLSPYRSGSMADLFEAETPAGERCLLKRPRSGFDVHPACLAGFETEQMILCRLAGPHVPRCLGHGEDARGPWLAVERIEGRSLEAIAAGAPLPATEVARLGVLLADALHALHRQNVVHQDLTPAHALLADDHMALIDFGLACHGDLPDLAASESDGRTTMLGTPATIAPEQVIGVRGDPRSDLFAAGAILYRLATGRYPFGKSASKWNLHRRRWFDPPPLRALNPQIPEWLQEIILHCLAVRRERRYASAAQLAHDLAHPDQVAIGERGRRLRRGGPWLAMKRWWSERGLDAAQPVRPARQLERAPHLLVAIDTDDHNVALAEAIRTSLQRLVAHDPHWRVTCVSVLEPSIMTEQEGGDAIGRSLHTAKLAMLRQWAHSLHLPEDRVRFHVLTGGEAAGRIVEHARTAHADHIVMGARGSSALRRYLGSVSARVVAEAPCSVTVVRVPQVQET